MISSEESCVSAEASTAALRSELSDATGPSAPPADRIRP